MGYVNGIFIKDFVGEIRYYIGIGKTGTDYNELEAMLGDVVIVLNAKIINFYLLMYWKRRCSSFKTKHVSLANEAGLRNIFKCGFISMLKLIRFA